MSGRRSIVVACLLLPSVLVAAPAAAQLFRWTDGDGVWHYTNSLDSIPAAFRSSARKITAPTPREDDGASGGVTVLGFTAGGPIVATVRVGAITLRLIVDTGADRTVIHPTALGLAGISTDEGRDVRIIGATGSGGAKEVIVPSLELAGARIGPVAVLAHAIGGGTESSAPPLADVDGLLGRDVLQHFTLAVDAAAGRATLRKR